MKITTVLGQRRLNTDQFHLHQYEKSQQKVYKINLNNKIAKKEKICYDTSSNFINYSHKVRQK